MRGAISTRAVAHCCCEPLAGAEIQVAVCYELPASQNALRHCVAAQRRITAVLRLVHGEAAEAIAVFAACDRDGERVQDYATAWGATEVVA